MTNEEIETAREEIRDGLLYLDAAGYGGACERKLAHLDALYAAARREPGNLVGRKVRRGDYIGVVARIECKRKYVVEFPSGAELYLERDGFELLEDDNGLDTVIC